MAPEVSSDFRHVVYTCFQPKAFATPEDLELKRTAYEDFRVTTHWPAYNVALFPEGGSGEALAHVCKAAGVHMHTVALMHTVAQAAGLWLQCSALCGLQSTMKPMRKEAQCRGMQATMTEEPRAMLF